MFPGCYNVDGRLRIKFAAVASPSFNHGIPCGADFVFGTATAPTGFVNGLPVSTGGALSAVAGAMSNIQNGIPFTAAGSVAYAAAAATAYQNGLPFNNANQLAVEIVP